MLVKLLLRSVYSSITCLSEVLQLVLYVYMYRVLVPCHVQDTGYASTQMMRPDVSHELYTGTCISEMAITTLTGTQVIRELIHL